MLQTYPKKRLQTLVDLAVGLGSDLARWPRSDYPQNGKRHGFRPLFLGGAQIHFWKRKKNIPLATSQGSPQIIENITEVNIFDVEENVRFFNI